MFAKGQAMRRIPMYIQEWVKKLDGFLRLNNCNILDNAGKISHEMAIKHAGDEYEKFHKQQLQIEAEQADEQNFGALARHITEKDKERNK